MLFLVIATVFSMADETAENGKEKKEDKKTEAEAVGKTCTSDERITRLKPTDAKELEACNVYYKCLKALKGRAPRRTTCRGGQYFKIATAKCVTADKCPNPTSSAKDKPAESN